MHPHRQSSLTLKVKVVSGSGGWRKADGSGCLPLTVTSAAEDAEDELADDTRLHSLLLMNAHTAVAVAVADVRRWASYHDRDLEHLLARKSLYSAHYWHNLHRSCCHYLIAVAAVAG